MVRRSAGERSENPCCILGNFFHEGAAVPFWAVVEAQHAGQCLIIAALAARLRKPTIHKRCVEDPRDRALRPVGDISGDEGGPPIEH